MIHQFLRMTFNIKKVIGRSRGQEVLGPATEYLCHFQSIQTAFRAKDGSSIEVSGAIYCGPDVPVEISDTVWIPGADPSDINQGCKPLRVDLKSDVSGMTFYKVVTV